MLNFDQLKLGMKIKRTYEKYCGEMVTSIYHVTNFNDIFKLAPGEEKEELFGLIEQTPCLECEFLYLSRKMDLREWSIIEE